MYIFLVSALIALTFTQLITINKIFFIGKVNDKSEGVQYFFFLYCLLDYNM